MDDDQITILITDCLNRESKLNQWELNFIKQIDLEICYNDLTDKQIACLNKIWDRVTS